MTGEDETSGADPSTKLGEATEAVRTATEDVETTSQRIAEAIEAVRQPARPLDRLANLTPKRQSSPSQSLSCLVSSSRGDDNLHIAHLTPLTVSRAMHEGLRPAPR